jgi:hypothetical protein
MRQFERRDRAALSQCNPPEDVKAVFREVMRLHVQGLMPRDIALAFGIDDADTIRMIYGPDESGSE